MVSARDFVSRVRVPLREGWGYIYGCAGTVWTRALQDRLEKTADGKRAASRAYGSRWIGRTVTDCSGLLYWALRQLGEDIVHHARYQYTDWCGAKGKLVAGRRDDGRPLLPGTAVFLRGGEKHIHHVGVYAGHGVCIEAKGARWGVVTSACTRFDHWGELKMVDYTDAAGLEEEPAPDLFPGAGSGPDTGSPVRAAVDNPGAWLNVRKGPGTGEPVLFRLKKGDMVEVLAADETGRWDRIRFGGQAGWAAAEYLRILEGDEPGPDGDRPEDPDGPAAPMRECIANIFRELRNMEQTLNQWEDRT